MTEKLIDIIDLHTSFNTPEGEAQSVNGVSFFINKGEIFGLVGESGSGKSVTALSIMRLLQKPSGYIKSGQILFQNKDLTNIKMSEMRSIRGREISMIFQEPMTSLNPVFTVGEQIAEVLSLHQGLSKKDSKQIIINLFKQVGIPAAEQRVDEYPHQLSGGMKQRVMIAMGLACQPKLIIADEPTTALDVTIQAQVLNLLKKIKEERQTSILLVTHNLGVVKHYADRIGVMYAGKIVEIAPTTELLQNPQHPYTKKLLESLPSRAARGKALSVIKGNVPPATAYHNGCMFANRCPLATNECNQNFPVKKNVNESHEVFCHHSGQYQKIPILENSRPTENQQNSIPLVSIDQINVHFPIKKGILKRVVGHVKAVDDFTLDIIKGKTTALVGESGCGKTTIGKTIVQLLNYTQGAIKLKNNIIQGKNAIPKKELVKSVQMIFQDPYSSLNPRMKVQEIIQEGLIATGQKANIPDLVNLLNSVGLSEQALHKYPHEFSGGQRQRISIARALALRPDLFICDEATSALDVSVQAQVLNLLRKIQKEFELTYLFITHDISVVEYLADNIAVMYLGRIVEQGPLNEVLDNPKHPYTKALLDAVPRIDESSGQTKLQLSGDVPSPINPPQGCHFHPRCPFTTEKCQNQYPAVQGSQHQFRCHHPLN